MSTRPNLRFLDPKYYDNGLKVHDVDPASFGHAGPPFGVGYILVEGGGKTALDSHEPRECWLVASGRGRLVYEEASSMEVRQGDILFFDARRSHQVFNDSTHEPLFMFSIWWRQDQAAAPSDGSST